MENMPQDGYHGHKLQLKNIREGENKRKRRCYKLRYKHRFVIYIR